MECSNVEGAQRKDARFDGIRDMSESGRGKQGNDESSAGQRNEAASTGKTSGAMRYLLLGVRRGGRGNSGEAGEDGGGGSERHA